MCSEAVPWRCHRRLISDYLIMVKDILVYGIIGKRDCPSPHKLTPFAHRHSEDLVVHPN
jgi:uncharacterized protein (DUF488 family)